MAALSTPSPSDAAPDLGRKATFYRAVWRWHFYAGLYVIPFFLMLAVTGMTMLWIAWIDGRDGETMRVIAQDTALPVSVQADAALAAFPQGGTVAQYIAPRGADRAAIFRIDTVDGQMMAVVDPYSAAVLDSFSRRSGWYDTMDTMHSDLMIGVTGDRMIEIAASFGIILLVTGLYLWWPRDGRGWRETLPRWGLRGRSLWRSLHGAVGLWLSVALLFFLISGLSWTGVWGEKMVQAWSSFPAGKYSGIPVSDVTHAQALNGGTKEVPWALEQTPMPASDPHAGHGSMADMPMITQAGSAGDSPDMDRVVAFAHEIGFHGRYQLNMPMTARGVWTISRDSMSTDSTDPTSDRIVHIDQYSGDILADVRFADYSMMGKAMAVGIALHMGTLGFWSVLANTVVCFGVIFLCLSGVVMWWKRRPAGRWAIHAPPPPKNMPRWRVAQWIAVVLALAFPMAGAVLAAVLVFDMIIRPRLRLA
ncbi:hypothetical protein BFP70_11135 [Thioclava sp. SK-1]|uniref:PepSY-associated TM helix domain-containing protein n=1 Tax=Thioclava sp. SK-1 TaxID=1889770 RepID=UPI000826C26D|nr:PepSY domain-containing protein [Thioclava sp. SK-1]OCX64578.1 hypothetical protein BFP70_11135 [Thioclava sp. SK-1]